MILYSHDATGFRLCTVFFVILAAQLFMNISVNTILLVVHYLFCPVWLSYDRKRRQMQRLVPGQQAGRNAE